MAGDDQDEEQKTEQPTDKRLEEALKKGNVPFSREITNFMVLAVLALFVSWMSPPLFNQAKNMLQPFIASAESFPADPAGLGQTLIHLLLKCLAILSLPFIAVIVAVLAAGYMQNGFILSSEPVMPKLDRISPLAGVKRLFSMKSVVEFLKSIIKIIIVGVVAFLAVYPDLTQIKQLPGSGLDNTLRMLAMLGARMTIGVAIAMFFIALLDLLWQRFSYIKSLRMSRQEIKDEYKQSEGDPMVKSRLRRLRQERARKRMMANVPSADVVITNPTHFSVALQYNTQTMKAPTVVAKGADLIALKIREIAKEHSIPIVENPPLARALYDSVDIDQEVPQAHYEAVAKVISYVYQLKGKVPKRR